MVTEQTFDRTGTMAALGEFIRARRRELGLTQTQLGARIGYYQERISALECGRYGVPSLYSLHELARALEVPVESLLSKAGCISTGVDVAWPHQLPANQNHLIEQHARAVKEYEVARVRFSEAAGLAEQVMQLRAQLIERRMSLQQLTASCKQMVH